ncbi:hypothetical protein P152DRAFT_60688 [Eremomyces bilateralis CBS 781.70]|uniref:Uncharacterized protein n=1 Tax=Eremomyces bilateralis CBS 781.70 TaxID=1392243 RepID=A0A6G1G1A6_9PEZI|nr:uncharacterized protein P152DRAFT_60688 [Eremomyces bilateralis CBS 781.70]KAF1811589.1 hypothetical protein P152DRAFT_60688 [Eremomyces bilateralis CBS 781.70]
MTGITQLLGPPILLLISIPLAVFALLTTALAFSLLFIRVSFIYLELALALAHSWLFANRSTNPVPFPGQRTPRKPRRTSVTTTAPPHDLPPPRHPPRKSDSAASLLAGAPNRDFEGVGGWRVSGDGEDEALWVGMNARLELPASAGDRPRRHQRSLTTGSQRLSWSPGAMRMSPVQSRARTPSVTDPASPEGYFGYLPYERAGAAVHSTAQGKDDGRRKSMSGSSTTSASSGRGSKVTVRHVAHA